jgi:hypothetical protein
MRKILGSTTLIFCSCILLSANVLASFNDEKIENTHVSSLTFLLNNKVLNSIETQEKYYIYKVTLKPYRQYNNIKKTNTRIIPVMGYFLATDILDMYKKYGFVESMYQFEIVHEKDTLENIKTIYENIIDEAQDNGEFLLSQVNCIKLIKDNQYIVSEYFM